MVDEVGRDSPVLIPLLHTLQQPDVYTNTYTHTDPLQLEASLKNLVVTEEQERPGFPFSLLTNRHGHA